MREAEYFGVCQRAPEIFLYLLEVIHFLLEKCQTFLFIVCLQVFDVYNRFRLPVGCKYILVQPLVHTLQHRVVVCVLIF